MAHTHETRDILVQPVLTVAAGILVLALVAFGSMWWLLHVLDARQAERSAPASPLARSYGPQEPPEPRLQVHPLDDLHALRAREDARLHTYAWVDRGQGIVRMPIERAMQLLAERHRRAAAR